MKKIQELERLVKLREDGSITPSEYLLLKKEILLKEENNRTEADTPDVNEPQVKFEKFQVDKKEGLEPKLRSKLRLVGFKAKDGKYIEAPWINNNFDSLCSDEIELIKEFIQAKLANCKPYRLTQDETKCIEKYLPATTSLLPEFEAGDIMDDVIPITTIAIAKKPIDKRVIIFSSVTISAIAVVVVATLAWTSFQSEVAIKALKLKQLEHESNRRDAELREQFALKEKNEQEYKAYQAGIYHPTIKIGNQVWTKYNLNVTFFQNGDSIPHAQTAEQWEKAGKFRQPAWCNVSMKNENTYKVFVGKLYNWWAVNDARGLAPKGFHIPNDKEFIVLGYNLGLSIRFENLRDSPEKIKWVNSSAGYRRSYDGYFYKDDESHWWTSVRYPEDYLCDTTQKECIAPLYCVKNSNRLYNIGNFMIGDSSNYCNTGYSVICLAGEFTEPSIQAQYDDVQKNLSWQLENERQIQNEKDKASDSETDDGRKKKYFSDGQGVYELSLRELLWWFM
jgi:uncharacterized protein (TIGR02145 family)